MNLIQSHVCKKAYPRMWIFWNIMLWKNLWILIIFLTILSKYTQSSTGQPIRPVKFDKQIRTIYMTDDHTNTQWKMKEHVKLIIPVSLLIIKLYISSTAFEPQLIIIAPLFCDGNLVTGVWNQIIHSLLFIISINILYYSTAEYHQMIF